MDKKYLFLISVLALGSLAAYSTYKTFFSVSGPVVVDYWAFATGVFLVSDGMSALFRSKNDYWYINFTRFLRISVGVSIFTIHFLQFVRDGKLGG